MELEQPVTKAIELDKISEMVEDLHDALWPRVKYNPDDDDQVFAATEDGEAKIWSISESKAKKKIKGGSRHV